MEIRASSLVSLFDCPARFEATQIKKIFMPKSEKAQLGTAIHAGTAAFDSSKLKSNPITADEACGAVVDAIYKPECDVLWEDLSPNVAEKIAIALNKKYCTEVSPKFNYQAVEMECKKLTITFPESQPITLTGSTDRVYLEHDDFGIVDIKTGSQAVNAQEECNTKGHALQLGVYELLVEQTLKEQCLELTAPAKIIGIQTGKTEKAQRIAVGTLHNCRDLLVGDSDRQGMLESASKLLHSGNFYGNPKSYLCHAKYCPIYQQCRFKE